MKVLQVALVMAVALCVAGSAVAATNAIPYMNSFEEVAGPETGGHLTGYTNGESIVNASLGWYAPDTANGTVVTQALDYLGSLPIPTADHKQVLAFTDSVTNMVDSGANTEVWLDCLIQPTRYDSGGYPDLGNSNDVKVAMFVNTNGQLVAYGGHIATNDALVYAWTPLGEPEGIGTSQWVRITVKLEFDHFYPYFQISLNNQPALTFDRGMIAPDSGSYGGSWFIMADDAATKMESITLSGTGSIDDLQVLTNSPIDTVNHTITSSVAVAGTATISPIGNVTIAESNSIPFIIGEVGGYIVTNVYVDYSWFTGWIGATNAYTMTNVVSDGSITVYTEASAPSETSAGTPHSYYVTIYGSATTTGWTNDDYENADTNDLDVDGMLGWQEYSTGTDASDSNSYFRVLDITYAGDSNKVSFFGTTAYGAPDNWSMYRSVNLTNGWDLINTNGIPVEDGTNNWWDMDAPGTAPVFYQPSSHIE